MGLTGPIDLGIVRRVAGMQTHIPIFRLHAPGFAHPSKHVLDLRRRPENPVICVAQNVAPPFRLPLHDGESAGFLPRHDLAIRQPKHIEVHAVPSLQ